MELKGLDLRANNYIKEDYSWNYAKNILIDKGYKSITNEEGFTVLDTTDENGNTTEVNIIHALKTEKHHILWCNGINSSGEQVSKMLSYNITNSEWDIVWRSKVVLIDLNNPILSVYRYNINGELIIIWNNGNDTTSNDLRIININRQLDLNYLDLNVGKTEFTDTDIADQYLRVFPNYNQPKFNIEVIKETSTLENGIYMFAICYNIFDNDYTDITNHSSPALISYHPITNVDVSIKTDMSINLEIFDIDTRYKSFKLIAITNINNVIVAYEHSVCAITTSTQFIKITNVPTTTVYINYNIINTKFHKPKSLNVIDERLIVANNINIELENYQRFANSIETIWNIGHNLGTTFINISSGEQREITLNLTTPMIDEVYAFYCWWELLDGTFTKAYHIPGRAPNNKYTNLEKVEVLVNWGAGNVNLREDDYLPTLAEDITSKFNNFEYEYAGIKKVYEVRDTCERPVVDNLDSPLQLGYWENKNEVYPNTVDVNNNPLFDIYTVNALGISTQVGTLINSKVRHHKMPSLAVLDTNSTTVIRNADKDRIIIKFKNIPIPSSYIGKVRNLHFGYAKRNNNISNVGMGIMYPSMVNDHVNCSIYGNLHEARFYNWQLLNAFNKPTIKLHYFKVQYMASSINADTGGVVRLVPAYSINNTTVSKTQNYIIRNNKYLIENNSASVGRYFLTSNQYKEECLHFDCDITDDNYNALIAIDYSSGGLTAKTIITLHTFQDDLFFPFYNQDLVNTGYTYKVTTGVGSDEALFNIVTTEYIGEAIITNNIDNSITSGKWDTFICSNFDVNLNATVNQKSILHMNQASTSGWNTGAIGYPANNIPFYTKFVEWSYANFHSRTIINTLSVLPLFDNGNNGIYYPRSTYNDSYKQMNNLLVPIIDNPFYQYEQNNNYLIARSIVQQNESLINTWRTFKPSEYYLIPNNKSEVNYLAVLNDLLFIQTKQTLYLSDIIDMFGLPNIASDLDNDIAGTNVVANVGVAEMMKEPVEILSSEYGTIGNKHRLACCVTPYGYCVYDAETGKIYLVNKQSVDVLTNDKVLDYIKFTFQTLNDLDNPAQSLGIMLEYDSKWDRLLLSIKNQIKIDFITNGVNGFKIIPFKFLSTGYVTLKIAIAGHVDIHYFAGGVYNLLTHASSISANWTITFQGNGATLYKITSTVSNSFSIYYNYDGINKTLSYSLIKKEWISLHDYYPSLMYNNRTNIYAINNNETLNIHKLYQMNLGNKGRYFGNSVYSSFIDWIFTTPKDKKILESIVWESSIEDISSNKNIYDKSGMISETETIDKILIYTDTQCSNYINIITPLTDWFEYNNARKIDGFWNFNNFADSVIDILLPIFDNDKEPLTITNTKVLNGTATKNIDSNIIDWFNKSEFINNFFIVRMLYSNNLFGNLTKNMYINDIVLKFRKSFR